MGERAMSLTLPPMLEPQMYLPPIRTTLKASESPKPSPSRPSGIRKVTHKPAHAPFNVSVRVCMLTTLETTSSAISWCPHTKRQCYMLLQCLDGEGPHVLSQLDCMQVQAGKPKVRRALKSEDSLSVSATDSEADSMLADSGVAKRKPGAKKGALLPSQSRAFSQHAVTLKVLMLGLLSCRMCTLVAKLWCVLSRSNDVSNA